MQVLNGTCFYIFHVFGKQSERIQLADLKFFLSKFRQLQKTKRKKSYFLETKAVCPVIFYINRKETSEVNVKTFKGSFAQSETKKTRAK